MKKEQLHHKFYSKTVHCFLLFDFFELFWAQLLMRLDHVPSSVSGFLPHLLLLTSLPLGVSPTSEMLI
ncbi:hypothetical protein K1719_007533 [Acacia pycnantha]|nr:hypothetical protein K1719_007533 [Acacia pycnantha]